MRCHWSLLLILGDITFSGHNIWSENYPYLHNKYECLCPKTPNGRITEYFVFFCGMAENTRQINQLGYDPKPETMHWNLPPLNTSSIVHRTLLKWSYWDKLSKNITIYLMHERIPRLHQQYTFSFLSKHIFFRNKAIFKDKLTSVESIANMSGREKKILCLF